MLTVDMIPSEGRRGKLMGRNEYIDAYLQVHMVGLEKLRLATPFNRDDSPHGTWECPRALFTRTKPGSR